MVETFTTQQLQAIMHEAMTCNDYQKVIEAESLFNQLLNQRPDDWNMLFMLSGIESTLGRNGLSIALLRRCEAINSNVPQMWNNLGTLYRKEHDNDKAGECLKKAEELEGENPDVLTNLTTLYVNEGNPTPGIRYGERAIKANPGHAWAHWNLSLCDLEIGNYARGFRNYAWGHVTGDRMSKSYIDTRGRSAPWWNGDKVGTLVVYGEQGVGDEVMFSSMIVDLSRFCKHLIIDAHPRLVGILKRSFPWVEVYATRKEWKDSPKWAARNKIDAKISFGSAARFLRYDETLFPKRAYLKPVPELIKLPQGGPKIGISWVGGTKQTRKDLRSIPLNNLLPLFEALPDAQWYSLQYTDRKEEIDQFQLNHGYHVRHMPDVVQTDYLREFLVKKEEDELGSFKDKEQAKMFCANVEGGEVIEKRGPAFDLDRWFSLASQMDAVVSINNSTVHFCGAIGKKCYVLTPSRPAWRYGLDREDMAWYGPWVKQFRQKGDNWTQPILDVAEALKREFT